jgi:hypothetical protein
MGGTRRYPQHVAQEYVGTAASGYNDRPKYITPTTCAAYISVVSNSLFTEKAILNFELGPLHYYPNPPTGLITLMYAALASFSQRQAIHHRTS